MPLNPEKNPLENIDFSKPVDKLEDLEEKIAAAKRGIILAQSLPTPDEERTQALEKALAGFEKTKKFLLENSNTNTNKPVQEFWVEPADMNDNLYAFGEKGAADKAERNRDKLANM